MTAGLSWRLFEVGGVVERMFGVKWGMVVIWSQLDDCGPLSAAAEASAFTIAAQPRPKTADASNLLSVLPNYSEQADAAELAAVLVEHAKVDSVVAFIVRVCGYRTSQKFSSNFDFKYAVQCRGAIRSSFLEGFQTCMRMERARANILHCRILCRRFCG